VNDLATLERIESLVIPPAWTDVWICADELGHLQAVGTDAAGRRQYLYHQRWRERRDVEKFTHVEEFAVHLPALRTHVADDLQRRGLPRERVLACAVRLLDSGTFRVGSDVYAAENGTFGLTTLRRSHVSLHRGRARFEYRAKSGVRRSQEISDAEAVRAIRALLRRPGRGGRLLTYRSDNGRWSAIRASDLNEYLRDALGIDASAKDFRTWHGTVLAALGFAGVEDVSLVGRARQRAVRAVVSDVAESLGNTPAVARRSYIDPRVIDAFESGITIAGEIRQIPDDPFDDEVSDRTRRTIEEAVLALLSGALTQPVAA
jgi:DNA topoisomerase-1